MVCDLPVPNPTVEHDLIGHPIQDSPHGRDVGCYLRLPNYVDRFIKAKDAPPQVWPVNAADWGFRETLPSQSDLTPHSRARPHPIVGEEDGEMALTGDRVHAAFNYW